jgi:hypothetical protein
MQLVRMTLWMYGTALRQAWECVLKNWVVSFAPLAYGVVLSISAVIAAPLGILGGLLVGLVSQACVSSGLYLIENMVRMGRADFDDFIRGFTVYIWELLRIAFILWIPLRLLSTALAPLPNGTLILSLIQLILYVVLNPVPEFIYQTRASGLELIGASYNFIVENWIEWFLPTIVLTILGYAVLQLLDVVIAGFPGFVQFFIVSFVFGLALTYFMLFRGFLFAELNGTTRRSRIYKYKVHAG